jgi:glycosyltransferase involved in cell wall biosynthesis
MILPMNTHPFFRNLRVLHILTLSSRNGDYGGPVRVAREICRELGVRGIDTEIFSGALKGNEPRPFEGLNESYVHVNSITRFYPLSTLWSWKLIFSLNQRIKNSDLVHIHFARDLISFIAALLCILNRKKFVTQSHGMIVPDNRLATKVIDSIFTIPLWKASSAIFVLHSQESSEISKIYKNSKLKILPNGIAVSQNIEVEKLDPNLRVAFCARLHVDKGIDQFLNLAKSQREKPLKFEIYGPDGGELSRSLNFIRDHNLSETITYNGALATEAVNRKLSEVDLVVLPSRYDNFPMVILEALSVGTPVLVMPTCGISSTLATYNPYFVARDASIDGLIRSFEELTQSLPNISRKSLVEFCAENFSISKVCDGLLAEYENILEYNG